MFNFRGMQSIVPQLLNGTHGTTKSMMTFASSDN